MKPFISLFIYNTRTYAFYAIRHLLLPVLIIGMIASACTSEISEEEMAAKTRTILDSVNKQLLRRLGGFADSIRDVRKGSLLAAYARYCNFDYDLPPAQFAYIA